MNPEKTKPDAVAASGSIEDREEPSTREAYTHAASDRAWEGAVLGVASIAGGDCERGERARRAAHDLCGQPFVSRTVWTVAEAVAWIFVAAILSADEDLRLRANAEVKTILELAAESRKSLGRAA